MRSRMSGASQHLGEVLGDLDLTSVQKTSPYSTYPSSAQLRLTLRVPINACVHLCPVVSGFLAAYFTTSPPGLLSVTRGRRLGSRLRWERSSAMQQRRRHFKQNDLIEQRLADEAKRLREEAELVGPGSLRDELLRRARRAEIGSRISEWLTSPSLQPPK